MDTAKENSARNSHWINLFLISFAVLFFEILFIRWIGSEIRIFAYFKNLILIAAIVGMGIGCALGGKNISTSAISPASWLDKIGLKDSAFPILITILCVVIASAQTLNLTHMSFLFTLDVFVWDQLVPSFTALVVNVATIIVIFMTVVIIFDLLGQKLGASLKGRESLPAYAVNLAGSLFGVIVFTAMCYLEAAPWLWLTVGFLAIIPFFKKPLHITLFIVSIAMAFVSTKDSIWSPYYRIQLKPFNIKVENGKREIQLGEHVIVNYDSHQQTMNFNKDFLKKNEPLLEAEDFQLYYNTYNFPYEVAPSFNKVLVLGAGTGNDVAAALRHGAKEVTAVEIDPTILKLGKEIHPEKPYSDSRVTAYNNDARAYLAHDKSKYDLIVFGHVDSMTTFSTLSSVRLDNFLYTKESLKLATDHLTENGICALSFAAGPKWLRARLFQVAKCTTDSNPVVVRTHSFNPGAITVFWGPGLKEAISKFPPGKDIIPLNELSKKIELPTDDWPFLYQKERNIPPVYLIMLATVITISSIIIFVKMRLSLSSLVTYSQFFFLGAGFLLLETRGMLAVSVLFGSTWLVNSIVIAVVLAMALCANFLVMKARAIKQWHGYLALFISLMILYLVPLAPYSGAAVSEKCLICFLVIGLPFLFSGIVFSRALAEVKDVEKALGINILGALLGGCLEYFSTIVGVNGLTLLSMSVYIVSVIVAIATLKLNKSEA